MLKFRQEKIFANFAICSLWQNFYHANFLSCVNDYIEYMATFTALAKNIYFCNTNVSGLGEIFVKRKFSPIWYCIKPSEACSEALNFLRGAYSRL